MLAPLPSDRLLEIGPGPGVAARLVADELVDGCLVAIDRSEVAVRRTTERNERHVAAGKVIVRHCPLERFDGSGGPFDKIYAINVNLLWVRDAKDELRRITTVLKPGGALYLFFEAPAPEKGNEIARRLRAVLSDAGFEPEETNIGAFLAFIARRPG